MDVFSFDEEKARESMLHIIEELGRCDKDTIINLFYLSDIEHLKKFGRPITGIDYIKEEYGIFSDDLQNVLENMITEGDCYKSDNKFIASRSADLFELSISDVKIFDEMILNFKNNNLDIKNQAWHDTEINNIITLKTIIKEIGDKNLLEYVYNRH